MKFTVEMSLKASTVAAVAGGIIGVGLITAAPVVILPAIGFSSSGVVAGSVAAVVHSKIGCVAAGSMFAALQSAGAVGAVSGVTTGVATAAGAAGGAAVPTVINGARNLFSRWR